MRSLWKGAISFGLVTIPVKLYAATENKDVKFNYLHEPCRTAIKYQKVCPTCQREVSMEEIVRGYEYEPGRYIIFGDEELESIPSATAGHTVDIVDFVNLQEIDPVFFDKTYYLEPGDGASKAYSLLRRAMEDTGRIALARVVIRSRETLAAIRVYREGVLAMETMYYPDEIRSALGLAPPAVELRDQELQMARDLVATLSGEFVPDKFQNDFRARLLELIQNKVAGEEVVAVTPAPRGGKVIDLMEALRQSLRVAENVRQEEAARAPARVARAAGEPFAAPTALPPYGRPPAAPAPPPAGGPVALPPVTPGRHP